MLSPPPWLDLRLVLTCARNLWASSLSRHTEKMRKTHLASKSYSLCICDLTFSSDLFSVRKSFLILALCSSQSEAWRVMWDCRFRGCWWSPDPASSSSNLFCLRGILAERILVNWSNSKIIQSESAACHLVVFESCVTSCKTGSGRRLSETQAESFNAGDGGSCYYLNEC